MACTRLCARARALPRKAGARNSQNRRGWRFRKRRAVADFSPRRFSRARWFCSPSWSPWRVARLVRGRVEVEASSGSSPRSRTSGCRGRCARGSEGECATAGSPRRVNIFIDNAFETSIMIFFIRPFSSALDCPSGLRCSLFLGSREDGRFFREAANGCWGPLLGASRRQPNRGSPRSVFEQRSRTTRRPGRAGRRPAQR